MKSDVKRYIVHVEISGTADIEEMASSPEQAVAMAEHVYPSAGCHELDGYSFDGEWVGEPFAAELMNDELFTDDCKWVAESDGNKEWAIEDGEVIPCDDENDH